MREFFKVACVLSIAAAILIAALAWADDRPDGTNWIRRWAPIPVALAALVIFLRMNYRADIAPDYLYQVCGKYFDRNGFCFAVVPSNVDGVCVLNAYFQNRHEGPCTGTIMLRQATGFFGHREIDTIAFQADCDGGAFGVVRWPIPVPRNLQGREAKFEVGASAEYPLGKGRMLRFRDGIVIRANTEFKNAFARTITIAGALGGAIVITSPAKTRFVIPDDVADCLHSGPETRQEILWKPGDEPLWSDDDWSPPC